MDLLRQFFNGATLAAGGFTFMVIAVFILRRDRDRAHAENIAHANRCEFLLTRKNEILHGMSSDFRRFVEVTEKTIQGETRTELLKRLADLNAKPQPPSGA